MRCVPEKMSKGDRRIQDGSTKLWLQGGNGKVNQTNMCTLARAGSKPHLRLLVRYKILDPTTIRGISIPPEDDEILRDIFAIHR